MVIANIEMTTQYIQNKTVHTHTHLKLQIISNNFFKQIFC